MKTVTVNKASLYSCYCFAVTVSSELSVYSFPKCLKWKIAYWHRVPVGTYRTEDLITCLLTLLCSGQPVKPALTDNHRGGEPAGFYPDDFNYHWLLRKC